MVNEIGKDKIIQDGIHMRLQEDLIVFRWLDKQISNKKAITACLLVLQGISYNAKLPDEGQGAKK